MSKGKKKILDGLNDPDKKKWGKAWDKAREKETESEDWLKDRMKKRDDGDKPSDHQATPS